MILASDHGQGTTRRVEISSEGQRWKLLVTCLCIAESVGDKKCPLKGGILAILSSTNLRHEEKIPGRWQLQGESNSALMSTYDPNPAPS
jgi:hypothetical protein